MFEIDKYSIKARLYPSFLVLLPVFILSLYYITDFEKYYHYLTATFVLSIFTYLLSQLGRDKGKSKEPALNKYFGGKPTTQILRHRNSFIDIVTKTRYHKLLSQKIENINIPSLEEEINDPNTADQIYDSCAKFIISKTRNTKDFNLLFKENVSYGFRRNLWGMKLWALIILFLCIVCHSVFAIYHFSNFKQLLINDLYIYGFLLVTMFFWIFIVTKNWIKITAFAYAERLYETLNNL